MNERRLQRLQRLIKEHVAQVVDRELKDPRRGLITITRVEVDREFQICDVFWSLIGDENVRRRNERMLHRARGFVQREVASVLHTRTVPHVRFVYDPSVEGAQRVDELLAELRREREARSGSATPPDAHPAEPPPDRD